MLTIRIDSFLKNIAYKIILRTYILNQNCTEQNFFLPFSLLKQTYRLQENITSKGETLQYVGY